MPDVAYATAHCSPDNLPLVYPYATSHHISHILITRHTSPHLPPHLSLLYPGIVVPLIPESAKYLLDAPYHIPHHTPHISPLYPLLYPGIVVPLIPESAKYLLDAPVPFILGTTASPFAEELAACVGR